MKYNQFLVVALALTTVISCKKDTLVEQVDVPATPIVAVKQKGGKPSDIKAVEGAFTIYELPYDYTALEPNFDALTTEIHYSKHLLGYVNSLNKGVIGTKYETLEIEGILKNLNASDTDIRNNAGGVYNHTFFMQVIGPNAGGEPDGDLLESIIKDFGSFDLFRQQFISASMRVVGSGWVWLVSDKSGKLKIVTTTNNDNPLMKNLGITSVPILTLDMWEHAYYLKFQNRRREYVDAFFNVINWPAVLKKYDAFPKISRSAIPAAPAEVESTESEPEVAPIVIPKPEEKPQ